MTPQTFEEQQTAMYCTMQSLMHQIEQMEKSKRYKFKFKQETEKYYKRLEKLVESFTLTFGAVATSQSYIDIVKAHDEIAQSVRHVLKIEE